MILRLSSLLLLSVWSSHAAALRVDADVTDFPRKLIHSSETIPVQPGDLTLLYPKWIQGEHAPTGPITEVAGLQIKAGGQTISWTRDPLDMHTLHLKVPADVSEIQLTFDYLLPASGAGFSAAVSSTPHILSFNWYHVVFYPKSGPVADIRVLPSLRIPNGWEFGTALEVANKDGSQIRFQETDLATLADSPVLIGDHFKTLSLSSQPVQVLHLAADAPDALEIKPETEKQLAAIPDQLFKFFGARPFKEYHFLLGLSDHLATFGLEHHQSSENRFPERSLVDSDLQNIFVFILAHEMTHSWNGKYRRPAGLTKPDFHQPLDGELLWVYEGLTDYLGYVIAARAGIYSPEIFRGHLARDLAGMARRGGRAWRPLADTCVAAQLLYPSSEAGANWRRSVDFYEEGGFFWLEADTLIRQKSNGAKSLEDFCKKFHGGQNGSPAVKPYTLDDVIAGLNETVAHDWRSLINTRIYSTAPNPPFAGIENSGWRLAYANSPTPFQEAYDGARKQIDLTPSIGLSLDPDGAIKDVVHDSAAARAGLSPGLKLIAVNGRKWNDKLLKRALESRSSIELVCEDNEFIKTYRLDYKEGSRYPILERLSDKPDLLTQIIAPRP